MRTHDFFTEKESAALYQELLDTDGRTEALMDIKNYMEDRLDTRFNAAVIYLCRGFGDIEEPVLNSGISFLFIGSETGQPLIYVGLAK